MKQVRIGIVFVHYHTPGLALRAVRSVERELAVLAGRGVSGRVVIVDNGSDAEGRLKLASLTAEIVTPGSNVGYSGGVNAGAERLADADVLLFGNPDVELLPGALGRLLRAIEDGAGAAGPRFFWDSGRRLRLPPTEARDPLSEALALMAPRSPAWAARARRRWRRLAHRHWRAEGEIDSFQLSGALLAVSRAAWRRVGPFDEGFRLYFEETDWLTRLAATGLTSRYVPAAEVVHAFARSTVAEPRAAEWFHDSAARYAAKHHPAWRRAALTVVGRRGAGRWVPAAPSGRPGPDAGDAVGHLDLSSLSGPLWVEVSPRVEGFPAAAESLAAGTAEWSLPGDISAGLGGSWWAQVTDDTGNELMRRRLAVGSRR